MDDAGKIAKVEMESAPASDCPGKDTEDRVKQERRAAAFELIRRRTAFHEAGHAVVWAAMGFEVAFAALTVDNLFIDREDAVNLGFVRRMGPEVKSHDSLDEIPGLLAGYASEQAFGFHDGELFGFCELLEFATWETPQATCDIPRAMNEAIAYYVGPGATLDLNPLTVCLFGSRLPKRAERSAIASAEKLTGRLYDLTVDFIGGPARLAAETVASELLASGRVEGGRIHDVSSTIPGPRPRLRRDPGRGHVARVMRRWVWEPLYREAMKNRETDPVQNHRGPDSQQ
jgi:hypothetical protein